MKFSPGFDVPFLCDNILIRNANSLSQSKFMLKRIRTNCNVYYERKMECRLNEIVCGPMEDDGKHGIRFHIENPNWISLYAGRKDPFLLQASQNSNRSYCRC